MDRRPYKNLPDYWSHIVESNNHFHNPGHSKMFEPQRPIYPNSLPVYPLEDLSSRNLPFQPTYALPDSDLSHVHTWNSPTKSLQYSTNKHNNPVMAGCPSQIDMMSAPPTFPCLVLDTSQTLPTATESSTVNDNLQMLK